MRAAVIVAGGRSTRFGDADKAVAELAGTPMIRRVADRISPPVDAIVINCREDQAPALREAMEGFELPMTFAFDEATDRGPLAGIARGLSAVTDATYAFVVACDMPFVEPDIVAFLFEVADGTDAAVPRLGDGWFQPTHAVYRVDAMLAAAQAALDTGDDRIVHALERLDYTVIEEDQLRAHGELSTVENVNTRDEFRHAEERLRTADDTP